MKREKLLVFVLTVRPFCCVGFSHMSKVTSLCVAILLRLVSIFNSDPAKRKCEEKPSSILKASHRLGLVRISFIFFVLGLPTKMRVFFSFSLMKITSLCFSWIKIFSTMLPMTDFPAFPL